MSDAPPPGPVRPPAAAYLIIRTDDGREMEAPITLAGVLRLATSVLAGSSATVEIDGVPVSGTFVRVSEATIFPKSTVACALLEARGEPVTVEAVNAEVKRMPRG